jgi:RimJ/RimL family protein N-acetyltransferase
MTVEKQITVDIRHWSGGDLGLLNRLRSDPDMNIHLGGPESPEKIREWNEHYRLSSETGVNPMFVIVVGPEKEAAGSIGYWEK